MYVPVFHLGHRQRQTGSVADSLLASRWTWDAQNRGRQVARVHVPLCVRHGPRSVQSELTSSRRSSCPPGADCPLSCAVMPFLAVGAFHLMLPDMIRVTVVSDRVSMLLLLRLTCILDQLTAHCLSTCLARDDVCRGPRVRPHGRQPKRSLSPIPVSRLSFAVRSCSRSSVLTRPSSLATTGSHFRSGRPCST